MKTDNVIPRSLGKLLAVWMTVVLGMANGWAVMLSPTSAQLGVIPSPAMAGQTVTLTMTVTGSNPAALPSGVVTFQEGLNVVLGSVNLNNGVAILDTRFSTTGIHGVTATYAGDGNNGGTSMSTWFNITAAATTIQFVSSINSARLGEAVTLTATVSGVSPTGTVTFRNGNAILGTMPLTAGTASITQTFNTIGNYALTTSYSGDTNNLASTSNQLTLAVSIEPQVYYIHTDHLDTPRTITATNGTVVWQWDNTDPFGANAPNENPIGSGQFTFNLRFAGQYFDRETGLYYNVNRDYSPALGRYIESDPIGLEGDINTYLYVKGRPILMTDPLGLTGWYCQRPLGKLPGTKGLPIFNHQYLCVTRFDGSVLCGGLTTDGNILSGESRITRPDEDYYDPKSCREVDDNKDQCFEQCVLRNFQKQVKPRYGIGPLKDCQEYADDLYYGCKLLCNIQKGKL